MTVTADTAVVPSAGSGDERPAWLDLAGPSARTVFHGEEDRAGSVSLGVGTAVVDTRPARLRTDRRALRPAARRSTVGCTGADAPSLHGGGLTRRGRIVVALAWMMLAIAAAVPVARAMTSDGPPASATTTVRVTAGDTLWEIAVALDPAGDPRELVSAIVELNGLESSGDIRPGDQLAVPALP